MTRPVKITKKNSRGIDALKAGMVAIAVNIFLLQLGRFFQVPTGHGGLFKWLTNLLGFAPIHWHTGLTALLPSLFWKITFHIVVGLSMALAYAYLLVPLMIRYVPAIILGLFYALVVWLFDAMVVLPQLGMGWAGSRVIPYYGLLYFAIVHTVFFVLLAVLYERFQERRGLKY